MFFFLIKVQVVGGKSKPQKNDNNNNSIKNRPGSNVSPQQRYHKKSETEPSKENPWKTKNSAAQLFRNESSEQTNSQRGSRAPSDDQRRSYQPKRTDFQNKDRSHRENYRDNKDKWHGERGKQM